MIFTEAQIETAIIKLLGAEGYPHVLGEVIDLPICEAGLQPQEVLIQADHGIGNHHTSVTMCNVFRHFHAALKGLLNSSKNK